MTAIIAGTVAGIVLSLLFFGGLWWTVRRVEDHAHPAGLLFMSFVVRTAVVLAAFYGLGQWRWEAMAVAAAGFIVTRFVLTRVLGPQHEQPAVGGST